MIPLALRPTLEIKSIEGLYGAGQFNGSSGYEEAAVQGFVAGVNAALKLFGARTHDPKAQRELHRHPHRRPGDQGDGGALPHDDQPPEYRLLLRQDNADRRLTPIGYSLGLVPEERMQAVAEKYAAMEAEIYRLEHTASPAAGS